MPIFRTYFKILKKQLPSILIYGIIFLVITVIITGFSEEENMTFSIKKSSITVVNRDVENSFLEGFLTYMNKYVDFVDIEDSEEARKDALFNKAIVYILTIPEGFTESLLAGKDVSLVKQSNPTSLNVISVDTAINNYINAAKLYLKYNPGIDLETLSSYLENSLSKEAKVSFAAKKQDKALADHEFNQMFFNYLGYIIVGCFILGVSVVMLSYNNMEIRRRHFASPVSGKQYNTQLILGNLVFVMCYLLVFFIAGFIFNPNRALNANTLFTWLNAIVYSFTILSISYLIGITVSSRNAVSALSNIISLGFAFIAGIFVPQEYLGDVVLKAASFTPAYWYVKANNTLAQLTNYNLKSLVEVFTYMGIQLGFCVAIISIALVISKRKRQEAY